MRTTSLSVHNDQILEIFTEPREEHPGQFFVWMVGDIKGQRTVLNHFATQDDYERRLCYIRPGDILWRDADNLDIPSTKNQNAIENEELIEQGVLWDDPRLWCYFGNQFPPVSRKALNAARKLIVGDWSDGTITLSFRPDSQLHIDFPAPASHHRFLFTSTNVNHADWWGLGRWFLFLMNDKQKCGEKIGLWKCDEHELHIYSDQEDVLVHPFHRVN